MTKFLIPFLLVLCSCNGCPPNPTPNPLQADCTKSCSHLRELGCEEGKPTPKGATCETICQNMPVNQAYLDCTSRITDCQQVNSCPVP